MSELVEVTASAPTVEIRLNRPDKKNALTQHMYTLMADALVAAEADPGVHSVLLSGAGSAFCAGNDLDDFSRPAPGGETPVARFLRTLTEMTVPVVVAVHGAVVGVGATMLLHCDFVVADSSARLQYPFVSLGLVPEAGSTWLLPRAVGHLQAMRLLMLAEPFDAARALELGLVTEVVEQGEHVTVARAITAQLAQRSGSALRHTKKLVRSRENDLSARIREESVVFRQLLAAPEFAAAKAAFGRRRGADAPDG
ncbi:MAG: enoyl-CoA hydratase-related protein [Pseudonocardia sp.]